MHAGCVPIQRCAFHAVAAPSGIVRHLTADYESLGARRLRRFHVEISRVSKNPSFQKKKWPEAA
jgi:hypothetical protein